MINILKIKKQKRPIKELLEFCIINVNKPAGMTSFDVCDKIRRILNAKKTGHFGTLDPQVTGVLPIAINRACRLSNFFMHKDKEYIGEMYCHKQISEKNLKKQMKGFLGNIMQKPPVHSRVKRVLRQRRINKFKIISKTNAKNLYENFKKKIEKNPKKFSFYANVEAGTYIRKLIHDLGEKIGGAHMIKLKRISAGIFKEKKTHEIKDIENAFKEYKLGNEKELRKILLPGEIIKKITLKIKIKKRAIKSLLNGGPLIKKDIKKSFLNFKRLKKLTLISVFYKNKLLGIYEFQKETPLNNKKIIAKPKFILN